MRRYRNQSRKMESWQPACVVCRRTQRGPRSLRPRKQRDLRRAGLGYLRQPRLWFPSCYIRARLADRGALAEPKPQILRRRDEPYLRPPAPGRAATVLFAVDSSRQSRKTHARSRLKPATRQFLPARSPATSVARERPQLRFFPNARSAKFASCDGRLHGLLGKFPRRSVHKILHPQLQRKELPKLH